jgi:hypothetical protein
MNRACIALATGISRHFAAAAFDLADCAVRTAAPQPGDSSDAARPAFEARDGDRRACARGSAKDHGADCGDRSQWMREGVGIDRVGMTHVSSS